MKTITNILIWCVLRINGWKAKKDSPHSILWSKTRTIHSCELCNQGVEKNREGKWAHSHSHFQHDPKPTTRKVTLSGSWQYAIQHI